jgi:hypothetical protein
MGKFANAVLTIAVVLIIAWHFGYIGSEASRSMSAREYIRSWLAWRREGYRSCNDCDGRMPRLGMVVLNPFMWPYSGTSCVDDLYILNKDSGLDLGFETTPITHLTTPDHAELLN